MSRNRLLFTALFSLVAIAGLLLATSDAWAQRAGVGGTGQGFQYVIKFICGEVTDVDANTNAGGVPPSLDQTLFNFDKYGQFLAPGEYYTIVNIHNPNEASAEYGKDWFKKFVTDYYIVQTGTDGTRPRYVAQKPGIGETHQIFFIGQDSLGEYVGTKLPPREQIADFTLRRDEASRANCDEIRHILVDTPIDSQFDNDPGVGLGNTLIKGFLIIYSKIQLDVTAVYTACDQGTAAANLGLLDCENSGSQGTTTMKVVRIESNGITPPAGIGLEDSASFQGTSFPTTKTSKDCPSTGCQYAVKYVCGEINYAVQRTLDGDPPTLNNLESDLSPGEYYTDINLHNPNPKKINVNKKFTADDPIPDVHGPLTSPVLVTLDVDDAIEINCRDIRESALSKPFPQGPSNVDHFIKGYVVFFTRQQIDIVATYTACPTGTPGTLSCNVANDVKTLDVRYILPNGFSPVAPPAAFLPSTTVASVGLHGEVKFAMRAQSNEAPLSDVELQVFDVNGRLLHDSGLVRATTLSWQPQVNGQPLAIGVYIYVVTARDVLGNVRHTVNKFVYLR